MRSKDIFPAIMYLQASLKGSHTISQRWLWPSIVSIMAHCSKGPVTLPRNSIPGAPTNCSSNLTSLLCFSSLSRLQHCLLQNLWIHKWEVEAEILFTSGRNGWLCSSSALSLASITSSYLIGLQMWKSKEWFVYFHFDRSRPDFPASVRPDLAAADVHGDEEEQDGDLGPQGKVGEACVQAPDHREDDHEELQQGDGHDHKVDRCCVDFLVDLAPFVDKSEIVAIHKVLEDEVEAAEGGDEGAGDGEHDDHRKDQHHPCVLLSKSEFIPNVRQWTAEHSRNLLTYMRPDCFSYDWSVCLAPGHTNLDEIPKQLWKPVWKISLCLK